MHISEGILSPPILAAGWAFAVTCIAIGLKKTKTEAISKVAVCAAAMFLISLVRVPVGPASVHLTLFGIMGAMLGFSVIPAAFVALLLQVLLFQFGGLAVLGVNTTTISCAALLGFVIYRYIAVPQIIRGFLTGFVAVLVASAMVASLLFINDGSFINTAKLIFAANLPLAVVEGIISAFILLFLKRLC